MNMKLSNCLPVLFFLAFLFGCNIGGLQADLSSNASNQSSATPIVVGPKGGPKNLATGLVAYYAFNNGSAVDLSESGYDGVINRTTSTKGKHHGPNSAVLFEDANNSSIEIQSHPFNNTLSRGAIYMRIKILENSPVLAAPLGYAFQAGTNLDEAHIYSSVFKIPLFHEADEVGLDLVIARPFLSHHTGFGVLKVEQWYDLVFSFDGSDYVVYRNGEVLEAASFDVNSAPPIPITIHEPLTIGNGLYIDWDKSQKPMTGVIDEFRIYNRPLSLEEVKLLYHL